MEIRFATKEMIPQVKEIWRQCFGDEEDYMEFYFTHRFTEENMLVCMEDKKPVAMTTFLKAYLVIGEGEIPVHYAYTVATLPEYRGRGYAKMLLEKGKQHFRTPIVLEPASESLIYYYEKLGFRMAFYVAERTILPAEIAEAKGEEKGKQEYWLLTVTPDEYVRLRDASFTEIGYIRWDKDAIAYALLENDYADGYAYKVQHHGREDILLFREEENAIEVLETTLSEQDLLAVLKRLRIKVPVRVRKSIGAVEREKIGNDKKEPGYQKKDFGMITGFDEVKSGYLNLTLE